VNKRIKIGLFALASCVAIVARTYYFAGEFGIVTAHYDGACTAVSNISGAEDATIHPKTGIAFISSYDRRLYRAGAYAPGAIFALDVSAKNPVPKVLTESFKKEFHPHGISLYSSSDGRTFLFAINHTKDGDFVEIFEYLNEMLEHRESISNPLMWRPNDLHAVGSRSFYVTNDHGSKSAVGRFFEDFIPLRNSYVLYFDGKTMAYAAIGIGQANGINMSADGKKIYVAASSEKAIRVFAREPVLGKLTPEFSISLDGFPDNIEVDGAGNLYVASMPKALTYMAHSNDGNKRAPSQILRVTLAGKSRYEVNELFVDDGQIINAATVAAPFPGGMLLGPSKDKRNQVLICRNAVGVAQ
jgi:arylesterase / paraoxonase